MNKIIVTILFLLLSGCSYPLIKEGYTNGPLPNGLKDCRFYQVNTTLGMQQLTRCPLSVTTTKTFGVTITTNTTIETNME